MAPVAFRRVLHSSIGEHDIGDAFRAAPSLPVLSFPNGSCADASTAPLAAVLQPGELDPDEMAPTTRSRYRVVGRQMAAGVSPRLVSALRHTFSTYYHCLLQLYTEVFVKSDLISSKCLSKRAHPQ